MRSNVLIRPLCAILFAALIMCAASPRAAACAGDMIKAAERLPDDVDLLLIVQNASSHRTSEAGAALDALARAIFAEGDTFRMWQALADQLGVTEEQAFDSLLGRRVVIAVRGMWTGEPRWALLSEVDRAWERRLRKRLPVAPRQIVAGRTVHSVEKGRYELIIERGDACDVVLFAPAAGPSLFDDIAPALGRGQRRPLSETPALRELRAMRLDERRKRSDIFFYLRIPEDEGGWIGGFASRDGLGLNANVTVRPGTPPPSIEPWRIRDWRALSRDALLCVVERRPAPDDVEAAGAFLFANLPWLSPDEPIQEVLADRHALSVHRSPSGLAITAAVELKNVEKGAQHGDAMMRSMVVNLSRLLGQGAWSYDFAGLYPEALRSVPLADGEAEVIPFLGARAVELSWTYRADQSGDGERGWMIGGMDRSIVLDAARGLSAPAERPALERTGQWLSVGLVKPAEMLEAIRATAVPIPPPVEALRWISYIGWHAEAADVGGIDRPRPQAANEDGARIKGFARIRFTGEHE